MTHTLIAGITALCLGATISITAFANPQHKKADTDQNGEVSRAEFNAQHNLRFQAVDTNADGRLSKEERTAHKQAMRGKRATMRFDKLDANSDNFISRTEFEAVRAHPKPKMRKMKKHMKRKHARLHKNAQHADTNQDGFIDRAEFDARANDMFTNMDANKDGVLSQADRELRKNKHKNKHSGHK